MAYNQLMKQYNWQQSDWPNFRYDLTELYPLINSITEKHGVIHGKLSHLSQKIQTETMIDFMLEEAVNTSAIEGEYLHRSDVRSSIINQLGLKKTPVNIRDKRSEGLVKLILNLRETFQQPLTVMQLFDWHLMLFASSKYSNIQIGSWRTHTEPMQIVSGYQNRQRIHYEAPPSQQIPKEMTRFIKWFNNTAPGQSNTIPFSSVRSAIVHLYFESIHPFEDGNGRIGRALSEKALYQGFGSPSILSLSQVIEENKKLYYAELNTASKSNEITAWITYFLNVIFSAQQNVERQMDFIIKKTKFFDEYTNDLNERQLKVIKRILQNGPSGFEGGINARKYMTITDVSKATATRDLQDLFDKKILSKIGDGRSTRYELMI